MPAAIAEITKRRVIQQWISGCSLDKIAAENNIGAGTVSSIVNNYKICNNTRWKRNEKCEVGRVGFEPTTPAMSRRYLNQARPPAPYTNY